MIFQTVEEKYLFVSEAITRARFVGIGKQRESAAKGHVLSCEKKSW